MQETDSRAVFAHPLSGGKYIKKCSLCGREYTTNHLKLSKYCGKRCSAKVQSRKYYEKQKEQGKSLDVRLCVCGKVIPVDSPQGTKYCSRQCCRHHYNSRPEVKAKCAARGRRDRAKRRIQERHKLAIDPQFKLRKYLRKRLRCILVEANAPRVESALTLCGCTIEELKAHLESQFERGMSWANYGPVWHIDHIIPVSKFNLQDIEHRRRAFNYLNLRPLFAKENVCKGARILEPSQIPLALP